MTNEKEYNSVVLAALLHDLGKLLNKIEKKKHPYFSAGFVDTEDFRKIISQLVDAELVKTLCQRHHENPNFPEDLLVQTIKNPRTRALAYLVSRADSYQATEREDEEASPRDFRETRLRSIFCGVNIGRGSPSDKYYKLTPLDPLETFPLDKDWICTGTEGYKRLVDSFKLKELTPKTFNHLFTGLMSIFYEHLWCVPSDATKDSDISLFDHLSISSAITACLYNFHYPDFKETEIKQDSTKKFLLVGGDLSGIQRFIYEIASNNPKHLSKTLRGRSFYVSLLCEAVSLKYLIELKLPLSCRLVNAGGQFVLLVPNKDSIKEQIKDTTAQVEKWFYKEFLGLLALNISTSVTLSGKDFKGKEFSTKLSALRHEMEKLKSRRHSGFLFQDTDPVMKEAYENLVKSKRHCEFCGIYPAIHHDKEDEFHVCHLCKRFADIGRKLVSSKYIVFGKFDQSNLSILDIGVKLVDDVKKPEECFLIEKIRDDQNPYNPGFMKRWIANYVPQKASGLICEHDHKAEPPNGCKALCVFCKSPCEVETRGDMEALSFQCIATHTLWKNKGGVDHLAVIKGDVDYLGYVFAKGFDDKLTISRWASLSRMLNLFFTGWIPKYLEKERKPIYTVYAGGDDFLLIAPWEEGIEFARHLQERFKEFTALNPNITLSIGINLMRPRNPLRHSAGDANRYLETAKDAGRDRLSLFGTTVKWELMEKLVDFKNLLDKKLNERQNPNSQKTKLNIGFLYRLLVYHEMFLEAEKGNVYALRYHSLMNYDVRRNISDQDTKDLLLPLYQIGGMDKDLMQNLKIPLFWTLYRNRGKVKLEEE